MARPVAYGRAFGGEAVIPVPVAASQSFRAEGGKFVTVDAVNNAVMASNNPTILGWALAGTFSSSTTAGATIVAVNVATDAVYEMPVVSALTESQCKYRIGKLADIEIISDIQYCNYDSASTPKVEIVGYKYYGSAVGEQSLLVKLSPFNASFINTA
jgi:hypothetical protein